MSRFKSWLRLLLKPVLVGVLAFLLVFSQADGAMAARAGGRIGGGSFRAPSRTYSSPRSYRGPSSGYPRGGFGFGFPLIMPFFGFGGGGLFSLLVFFAIASFLVRSFRSSGFGDGEAYTPNPTVSVARLQVGLLAKARHLQDDLNRLATSADTSSSAGLTKVLQESTLSLLRHPEYWAYADTDTIATKLTSAEAEFNRLALMERSKFSYESVSNVNNQLSGNSPTALPDTDGNQESGEYIIATLIVATQGKLTLPDVQSEQTVRNALNQIGAIPSDTLMAVEILWTPQASGETLTNDEVIAQYPNLKLV
ncbi:DUF1517 domain-containing protein [Leptolyngbya cf. ectocarpi LEGE 11479]|uniref:DUF1517 domain-containing protein n=1 Tax=Leptolyngbya cf. ectocarpi LEGE 11479 TaxID=1828722 RepID=A0A928ZV65_LEPEC|nr:DUF1517 domain-containing protein [Leptolyngbya ectocarpi]MBE9068041.1 DUF1517 domain-containing protein [Leptolyngbya cf. ectocarpi LEGE 11479]